MLAVNCAHLGCPVSWFPQSGLFMCPCHGGVYYANGDRASGPPPRGLFRCAWRIASWLCSEAKWWKRVRRMCGVNSISVNPVILRGCEEIRHPESAKRDEGSQNATAVHFEILRRLRGSG